VSIIIPSPSFISQVASLSSSSSSSVSEMRKSFVRLLRSDPASYLLPVLNEKDISSDNDPAVSLVMLQEDLNIAQYLYPCGPVFSLDSREKYSKDRQSEFWHSLLKQPDFLMDNGSKDDFKNNMVQVLHHHAWWHLVNGEYDISKYLYVQALRYSRIMDPQILSGAAKCSLELREFEEAFYYSKRTLDHDPDNKLALNTLGIVYAASQDPGSARLCFERILTLYPGDEDARKNLEMIGKEMKAQPTAPGINGPVDPAETSEKWTK
jgi:tetratricopeptide (TPR) repeat protein